MKRKVIFFIFSSFSESQNLNLSLRTNRRGQNRRRVTTTTTETPITVSTTTFTTTISTPSTTTGQVFQRFQKRRPLRTTTTSTTVSIPSTISEASNSVPQFQVHPRLQSRRPLRTTTITTTTSAAPEIDFHSGVRGISRRRTTTVKYHNHRYPEDPVPEVTLPPLPSEGLKVIKPPKFNPLAINEDLLGSENQNQEVILHEDDQRNEEINIKDENIKNIDIKPQRSTSSPIGIDIPADLKGEYLTQYLQEISKHFENEMYLLTEKGLLCFYKLPMRFHISTLLLEQ